MTIISMKTTTSENPRSRLRRQTLLRTVRRALQTHGQRRPDAATRLSRARAPIAP
jgi:hypothetical protein